MDAQAGLGLCCSQTPEDRVSRVEAQISEGYISNFPLSLNFVSILRKNFTLPPSQQFFSHVGMFSCLPGLNQYKAEDKVSSSRTQHSASVES